MQKVIRRLPTLPVLMLLVLCFSISANALRRERLIDGWKPKHYQVSITLDSKLSQIQSGQTDIDIVALTNINAIDLDFGALQTDEVKLNGNQVPFTHREGKLDITLPLTFKAGTEFRLSIEYHGKPTDGLILTNDKDGKPAAVGDNWPNRVHHWIPSFDHPSAKATVTYNITVGGKELVIANGKFSKVETNSNGSRTWTYNETVPIPPYCMVIAVGDFALLEPAPGPTSTPLFYYVPPSDSAYAAKGFSPAVPALQMFSETVGPYPYHKLALIVGATRFGGMENSGAIVFTSTLFNPKSDARMSSVFGIPESLQDVVAHEIAHQWFGDSVTESTWSDLWLSEGFATYFAALFAQKHQGEETFQRKLSESAAKIFAFEQKSHLPIHDRETEDLFKLLNANNYQKGSWVLHMLRSRLGDAAFFRGVKTYYERHKNSTASTEDLRDALEDTSGQKLRPFFERWVYDSGHPQYQVEWKWIPKQKSVRLTLTQTQTGNVFNDPVPVEFKVSTGVVKTIVTPKSKVFVHTVRTSSKPERVDVDPQNTLLKEVKIK